MRNFQDTFETRKRSFICAFSICMTVPLSKIYINHIVQLWHKSIILNKIYPRMIPREQCLIFILATTFLLDLYLSFYLKAYFAW